MGLIVKYKGKNISDKIEVKQYIHDTFAEQHGDTLDITFDNTRGLWDKWNPKAGDIISVTNGNEKTGKMYVKNIIPTGSTYVIRASSVPESAKVNRNGAWEGITFFDICKDIAKRHGLEFKKYGVNDRKFDYIKQSEQSDFIFLTNICILEACAFIVYDGTLILYSEKYMESRKPVEMIINGKNQYKYNKQLKYTGCTLSNGGKTFTHIEKSTKYVAEKNIEFYINSKAEAEKYAKNMLKYLNKNKNRGYFYTDELKVNLAAGTTLKLKNEVDNSMDGVIFLTRVRHDYKKGKTKVFFRKVD